MPRLDSVELIEAQFNLLGEAKGSLAKELFSSFKGQGKRDAFRLFIKPKINTYGNAFNQNYKQIHRVVLLAALLLKLHLVLLK